HVCFSRSATVQDAGLMDVGQELALSIGVSWVHTGLSLVDMESIHGSRLRWGQFVLAPDAGESGLDLLIETFDQFAIGFDVIPEKAGIHSFQGSLDAPVSSTGQAPQVRHDRLVDFMDRL
ncbi:MAG: hypothetical protein Q8P64_14550, partial [Deltaproteobacteria bacterium]|nr:hypothetical protein [Deltaproteobacteria bacterium]